MGKKFFYCANHREHTSQTLLVPNSELGQELGKEKLCNRCREKGYVLRLLPTVVKQKK